MKNIKARCKRKQGNAIVKLDIDYKTDGNTKRPSAKDDTSKLSGFARVIRIRNIVQDFFAATLIRDLKGIEQVRSPIVRTNLMSKNVNFRTCLELWEYIERYKGPGYTYQNRSFDGNMPLPIKDNLQDTVIFGKFLTEITFNPEQEKDLRKELNQEIREKNKQERQQLLLLQSKAKDEQRQVGERALERAKQSFEKQVLKEKEKLEKEKEKSKARQEKIEAKHQKTVNHLKLRNENHRQKRELLQTQKKALQQEKSMLIKEKRELQKQKRELEKQQKVLLKAQKTLNDINAKKQEIREKNQNKAKNERKNTKKQQKTN